MGDIYSMTKTQTSKTERYEITKRFTGGLLEGITIVETMPFYSEPGTVVAKPIGGSPYVIEACRQISH